MDLFAIWNALKGYLIGIIVRWLMVVAGTVITTSGLGEGDVVTIVGGILTVLVSFIISLVQHKKAVDAVPPVQ